LKALVSKVKLLTEILKLLIRRDLHIWSSDPNADELGMSLCSLQEKGEESGSVKGLLAPFISGTFYCLHFIKIPEMHFSFIEHLKMAMLS
jgi:hypothetical protein